MSREVIFSGLKGAFPQRLRRIGTIKRHSPVCSACPEFNMANQSTLPLYDKIWVKHTFSRVMDSLTLLLLLLLLGYRVFYNNNYTFPCFVAFLCESCFTFTWVTIISTKWSPAYTKTYLDRLLPRYLAIYMP